MVKEQHEPVEQGAPVWLQPLPDALHLLEGDAAGYCSDGVCHIPAPKTP